MNMQFLGLLMVTDIPEERGGSELDIKWGEPRDCHFPLFNFLRPLPLPYMGLLYGAMWLGMYNTIQFDYYEERENSILYV